jgi:hypothetical protein
VNISGETGEQASPRPQAFGLSIGRVDLALQSGEESMLPRFAVVVCVLASAAGCAARGTVATPGPTSVNLSTYSRVAVNVVSGVQEDVAAEAARLEGQIVEEVRKTRRFGTVETLASDASAPAPGTLRLTATITEIRKVSGGKRFFAGAFAGRAKVTVKVQLVEAPGGTVIEEQTVSGESGGTGLSGGTNDALSQAAKAIAKWLVPQA